MDISEAQMKVLGFKSHLRAEVSEGNGVYLFSERGVTALQGAEVAALASLLDGTKGLDDLLRARPGGMDEQQISSLVQQLVAAGLVMLRDPKERNGDERARAYWDACGVDSEAAARHQPTDGVALFGLGEYADTASVRHALCQAGLDVVLAPGHDPVASAELSVVLCDDYLDPRLAQIDATHRAAGKPWLLAKPVGAQVWLGPVFQPGDSPCWHCLTHRLWGHRHAEACAQASLGRFGPASRPPTSVPALMSAASHLIALEATKWLAGHRYPGQNSVWTLDTFDLNGRLHELKARPQCSSCGDTGLMAERALEPVILKSAKKVSTTGGGHRTMTPDQVLARYSHLIGPVTGIVKEIQPVRHAPEFINSFRSGPNIARNVTRMDVLRSSLRTENGGKGSTPLDAEVGALCEALERYSGSYEGDELRIRGSLTSLGSEAIHPNECMLFAEEQYASRVDWNPTHSPFNHVCEKFDPEATMDWTPLWSLTDGKRRLLPTGLLYFSAPTGKSGLSVRADSNGNAAGSSLEDAILQGLLELVERDAVALWWYNRTMAPAVDLAAFGDTWVNEQRRHYAKLNREVWVLDVTSDLGIPVMAAITRRSDSPREDIIFGFGAHPDPRVALRRALSELNQMLPAVLDEDVDLDDPDAEQWLRHATVANQNYLLPDWRVRPRVPADFGYTPRSDVRDDVKAIVAELAGKGMETLVLDQTRPDVELPVVKVVVPGLRTFWARFAPGRLYDVPVRLGRLSEPRTSAELNPIPLFL
jgi:bacteriocin biosynthesis cyclodehydratase domain-containing protein